MLDKNQRIYFSSVPDINSLPKIEKKIMITPLQVPDNLNAVPEGQNLDSLVPREVKAMIENYKRQMMDFISENLNKYENESTIYTYLAELNLPQSLESVLSQSEISESLWKKISEVQQKGATLFLTSSLNNLEKKPEEVEKKIREMLMVLANEEEEDKKLRNIYGDRWTRASSAQLNAQYVSVLNDYASNFKIFNIFRKT